MIDIEQEAERIFGYDGLNPHWLALEIKDLINRLDKENKDLYRQFELEIQKLQCDGAFK